MSIEAKNDAAVYLRSDTKIEPLACGWYVWGHLVPPIQQAFNIAFRQLSLLKSFVTNPSIHEAASLDPTLLGAPFIQLRRTYMPEVAALIADTLENCSDLIHFAENLMALTRQLKQSATGYSLEALYRSLAPNLAGLIELSYDLSNQPGLRVNEELSFGLDLDNSKTQQIAFSATKDRDRGFFLNTPRLASPERLILPLPFADSRFETLAVSRIRAVPQAQLLTELHVPPAQRERLFEFFSECAPHRNQPHYLEEDIRVRYFGHACVLLQAPKVSILVDPMFAFGHEEEEATLTFDDLPDFIDYVFITHNHHDHFSPEMLLQLRARLGRILVPRNNSGNLADPSMRLTLRALGFDNVTVMEPLDVVSISDGAIVSLPFYGEHADLNIRSKHGMYLSLKGKSFAFLADSNCLDRALYRRLTDRLGKVDTLFIGMECDGAPLTWLYSPYLPQALKRKDDESRRLSGSDCERAWSVVEELSARRVFVYAMGQEPWLKYICGLQYTPKSKQIVESDKLVERCRQAGIPAERLYGCREMYF